MLWPWGGARTQVLACDDMMNISAAHSNHWPVRLSALGRAYRTSLSCWERCLPAPPNWDYQNYLCSKWKLHVPVFHEHLLVNEFMYNVPQSSFCCFRTFSLKRATVERDYAQVSPSGPAQLTCCSCCWSSVWPLRSAGSAGAGHHQPSETSISLFRMFRSSSHAEEVEPENLGQLSAETQLASGSCLDEGDLVGMSLNMLAVSH